MTAMPMTDAEPLSEANAMPRYPLADHLVGLLPLAALIAGLFLLLGGEGDIARHFAAVKPRFPDATAMMKWLTKFGNVPFYLAYAALFFSVGGARGRERGRFVIRYLFLLALLLLVSDMLKIWVGRPRPDQAGEYIMFSLRKAQHSFPSNHMTETVFSLLSLALYCRRRPVTVACGLGAAVMGLTRIYLGRHHPTDLLGSAVLGSLWVYLLWRWGLEPAETKTE